MFSDISYVGLLMMVYAMLFLVFVSRTKSLDAEVSASGFTKEMQQSLEEEV